MKVKPMLGAYELPGLEQIQSDEYRSLVEHKIPGLEGAYLQDMGSAPNTIALLGSRHGDEIRDQFLTAVRGLFNTREPTTFVANINTATEVTDAIIENLQVVEGGGTPRGFRYFIRIREYIEPPAPLATGPLDRGILDDAEFLADALDALGSLPDLVDPTEPLRGAVDGVRAAMTDLDNTVRALNGFLSE